VEWPAVRCLVVTVPATGLFVAPCSREAATFAVRAWHYSHAMASGRVLAFGAWCDSQFEGSVTVSRGACPSIGQPFALSQNQIAEVTRIALRPGHVAPVSQVLAIVVRLLRRSNPGLELLISYSDQRQGHTGLGVYAACNWTYLGETAREALLWIHGREVHARTVSSKYGTRDLAWLQTHVDAQACRIDCPPKHRWALALSQTMRGRLIVLAQPYPTRDRSTDSGARGPQAGGAPSTLASGTTREGAAHVRPGRSNSEVAHA
jgi:hypothetical protein